MANGILILYILLLLVGGWFGLKKAGSKVSLATSATAAALLLLCVLGIMPQASTIARFILGLLLAVFVIRLAKTRKFMPSGMLVCVTALTLLLHFLAA